MDLPTKWRVLAAFCGKVTDTGQMNGAIDELLIYPRDHIEVGWSLH